MKKSLFISSSLLCLFILSSVLSAQSKHADRDILVEKFQNPPKSAHPWVFWYWMKGAVTRDGITTDLEAMKKAGIYGAYLVPIQAAPTPPLLQPVANTFTPAWWDLLKFAFEEARRLGLHYTMHTGDGFATAGGPWITPDLSMQKIVWSKINIDENSNFNDFLPVPEHYADYYKDISIYAFPTLPGTDTTTQSVIPEIFSSTGAKADFLIKPDNKDAFKSEDSCWIQYSFKEPFTLRSVLIRCAMYNYQSHRLRIEISNDGIHFKFWHRLSPSRNGWLDWDAPYTHAIPEVTAKYFRFVYNKEGSEPGSEDNEMAKWKPSLKLIELQLSSEPVIHQYESKNGMVWRIAETNPAGSLGNSLCVPLKNIINVTEWYKNNRLNWNVPAGKWTILRMGYTSTGHMNMTAGTGKGLECDKLNPAAITLQYNNWFGEIKKHLGTELTSAVLENIHVDSWECSSQNWSPVLSDAFLNQNGYNILKYLPAVAGIPIEQADSSEKFLYDLRTTIANLMEKNFYGTLNTLAKTDGFKFTGESSAPVMVCDGMEHYKTIDVPMGEFWVNSPTHDKPVDIVEAISAAHIYGKNIIQSEAFTTLRMDWTENPQMLKPIGDRNYALGINRFVFHVFCQNPWPDKKPGMTLGPTGIFFQPAQTWWDYIAPWMDYTFRCQALLQSGNPVTDIAIFTGNEMPRRAVLADKLVSLLPGLAGEKRLESEKIRLLNKGVPMKDIPDGVTNSVNTYDPALWVDPLNGYAYDSFNPDAFKSLFTVKNGNLYAQKNGEPYKLLVFPGQNATDPNSFLSNEQQIKIDSFVKQGVNVLINSNLHLNPVLKNELASNKIFKTPYLQNTLESMGIPKDFTVTENGTNVNGSVAWTHRKTNQSDIYFVANQKNQTRILNLSFRIDKKIPEIWNPVDGSILKAQAWKSLNGRTEIPVKLEPNQSLFFVFTETTNKVSGKGNSNWDNFSETQILGGPWQITFLKEFGGTGTPVTFDSLYSWSLNTDSTIKFYSGTAKYSKTFEYKGNIGKDKIVLNLGKVCNIARVRLNGISCGIVWTSPMQVDISGILKKGTNTLEIDIANTWLNRLLGDSNLPNDKKIANTVETPYRLDKKKLQEAGLLGPVKILIKN
jgi:hypothetical protein